jgi:hypothetical protein
MWIDEAGGDDKVGGVDRFRGSVGNSSDLRDYSIFDCDVGATAKRPGAIDDGTVFDDQVICHRVPRTSNATLGIAGRTIVAQGFT